MSRTLAVLVVLSLLSPALAQKKETVVGSGKVVSETRELAEFDEIELGIAGDINVKIGEPTPLTIETDDNILPLIKTEVRERRLLITADTPFRTEHGVDMKITVANIEAAQVCGSGDMRIRGLDNKTLSASVNGSGDLHVDGKTEKLSASIAGSGDIHLVGKAECLTVSIAGSGDLHAFTLSAIEGSVSIAGSGDANVNVSKSLNVSIIGSGDVHYQGDPQLRTVIQGSGDVKRHG